LVMEKMEPQRRVIIWGSITACTKTLQDSDSKSASALGYVRFSSEEEADTADWAGPHYIGGMEVEVKGVVSLKVNQNGVEVSPARSIRGRSMGLFIN
uniref:RRM domain-containing protein n=1 Tax=Salmo trutta TaxID=8032 RepID=A0A674DUS7_SALTR